MTVVLHLDLKILHIYLFTSIRNFFNLIYIYKKNFYKLFNIFLKKISNIIYNLKIYSKITKFVYFFFNYFELFNIFEIFYNKNIFIIYFLSFFFNLKF